MEAAATAASVEAKPDQLKRFQEKVVICPETGCHLWVAAKDKDGYGKFQIKTRTSIRAHRLAYLWWVGSPEGLLVCHTCDTPSCVNPKHLFLGDHAANHADRGQKMRQAKGEMFPLGPRRRRLTEALAQEILDSSERESDLVRRLKLPQPTVNNVRTRRTWKHLQPSNQQVVDG